MNTNLLDQLLNESESAYLDFKREQYVFEGASDDVKSELLKDILAFTNAWRRTDAYILIGVEEVKGSRNKVVGITKHLEDHSLQQFINSKTQQPVTISYIPITFEGLLIGVIKIPVQSRPIYLKKDFGKLKKNIVYIRRGSSTDEAFPDEIAKMGAADVKDFINVDINIEFADIQRQVLLGKSITLKSKILDIANDQIPDFLGRSNSSSLISSIGFDQPNKRYYKELVRFFNERLLTNPVGFAVKNLGHTTVHNVKMLVTVEQISNLILLVEDEFSEQPKKYFNVLTSMPSIDIPSINNRSNLLLETYGNKWVLSINYGNVQPKATIWSDEAIFIGSRNKEALELNALIYADELPEPISVNLNIGFDIEESGLKLEDLEKLKAAELNRLFNELDND